MVEKSGTDVSDNTCGKLCAGGSTVASHTFALLPSAAVWCVVSRSKPNYSRVGGVFALQSICCGFECV